MPHPTEEQPTNTPSMQAPVTKQAPPAPDGLPAAEVDRGYVKQPSTGPSISDDGRFIAYQSRARYLLADEINKNQHIYLLDRSSNTYTRLSVSSDGERANADSFQPAISGDGQLIAFASDADNLVEGDTNGCTDVFLHDRRTGKTIRISIGADQAQADKPSREPGISANGRFVVFHSTATNLVSGDTNKSGDVFVRDLAAGTTTRASVTSAGEQANAGSGDGVISDDGRFVAFYSHATNLVADDTNKKADVFLRDLKNATTTRLSVGAGGEGNGQSRYPSISGDGQLIVFESFSDQLVSGDTNRGPDAFVFDRRTNALQRVSVGPDGVQANNHCRYPVISPDGRFVAYEGHASNLVPGDTNKHADVFVYDRTTGRTTRVSVSSTGTQGKHDSAQPDFSADGRFVVFGSKASNLYPNDKNHSVDVLLHDRQSAETVPISQTPPAP